jgi:hypothetical protein
MDATLAQRQTMGGLRRLQFMKLSRLFQPRNPLFWMMVVLNALSSALAWVVHNQPLSTLGLLVVGGFALGNAVLGTWLAWRLIKTP